MCRLLVLLVAAALPAATEAQSPRVDASAYVGWRVFDAHCASCHGLNGEGTSFAPDLAPRIERMDQRSFARMLEQGYSGVTSLPPWGEQRDVARYSAELWLYLSRLAAGDLSAGPLRRPE